MRKIIVDKRIIPKLWLVEKSGMGLCVTTARPLPEIPHGEKTVDFEKYPAKIQSIMDKQDEEHRVSLQRLFLKDSFKQEGSRSIDNTVEGIFKENIPLGKGQEILLWDAKGNMIGSIYEEHPYSPESHGFDGAKIAISDTRLLQLVTDTSSFNQRRIIGKMRDSENSEVYFVDKGEYNTGCMILKKYPGKQLLIYKSGLNSGEVLLHRVGIDAFNLHRTIDKLPEKNIILKGSAYVEHVNEEQEAAVVSVDSSTYIIHLWQIPFKYFTKKPIKGECEFKFGIGTEFGNTYVQLTEPNEEFSQEKQDFFAFNLWSHEHFLIPLYEFKPPEEERAFDSRELFKMFTDYYDMSDPSKYVCMIDTHVLAPR